MSETQNYQNHTRYYPLVHFVLFPILLFNLIWQSAMLYFQPSWNQAEIIVVALALIMLSLAARLQALKAQDRIVRLEETLRYKNILSAETAAKAEKLTASQMIALRFASDEELPAMIERTVSGELKTSKEIKTAIKNWRADYFRV